MKAEDIAKDLEREGKFPGHVVYGTSPLLIRAANMLRRQADRIAVLEANHKIQLEINEKALQYIKHLEDGLESSIKLNKAQAERQEK